MFARVRTLHRRYACVCLLWVAASLLFPINWACEGAEIPGSKHDFFLVDVSGSMRGTPLQHRKAVLKEWIATHPAASVTLMSFGKGILSSRNFRLSQADEHRDALRWIDGLRIEPGLYSYVWDSCRIVLNVASDIQKDPDRPVTLHVLTDALDNQGFGDLDSVLRYFPNAHRETPSPAGTTDFTISLAAAVATPSPTASPISGPTPTAPPTATATATATATPTATPKTTATETATATPKSAASAAPTATPCSSVSPCDARAAFEIQEARVVADDQTVHFINRTVPPATSYLWRLERNWGDKDTASREPDKNERTSNATHFIHRFQPAGPGPRSYIITLQADFNGTRVDAAPVTVLVPEEQDWLTWLLSALKLFCANFAQAVTAITTVVSAVAVFWEKLKKPKPEPGTPWTPEVSRRVRPWPWKWIAAFFVSMSLFLLITANRSSINNAWGELRPPVLIDPGPSRSPTVPADQPAPTGESLLVKLVLGIALVGGTLVAVVAFLRFVQNGKLSSKGISPLLAREETGQSLSARLDEIERLRVAQVIPAAEMSILRSVLFDQLKQKYGLEEFASVRPRLTDDLKKLIEALSDSTVDGRTTWKIKRPEPGNPTTSESKEEVPPPMRFYCELPPDKRAVVSSPDPHTPANRTPAEEANNPKPAVPKTIEIYADQTGFGIDIVNNAGEVIESINRATFLLSARSSVQIAKLFRLARNSGLQIAEHVKAALDLLEVESEAAKPGSPLKSS